MKICITGGAGCIGSELAIRLVNDGHEVLVIDNLSSGKAENIKEIKGGKNFRFLKADMLDTRIVVRALGGIETVFHLAANPDIKYAAGSQTDKDLKSNTIATYNLLEAMRKKEVKKIVFSSSSAVYGEAMIIPTQENYGPLEPISLYGASKLACEGLISAYCSMFGMQSWIFRLGNIVGDKSRKKGTTAITDFIMKLRKNPKELEILGNGKQSKSYMLVDDCIDGMLFGFKNAKEKVNIFNLSSVDALTVTELAQMVALQMKLEDVTFKYTGGERGWPGDVPKVLLSIEKIIKLGWRPKYNSRQAAEAAIKSMLRLS